MREAVVVVEGVDLITADLVTLARVAVPLGGGYYASRAPIAGGARPALRPVPTLDQLVRNPQLLDGVPLATLIDLDAQVGHLGIALRAQITRQNGHPDRPPRPRHPGAAARRATPGGGQPLGDVPRSSLQKLGPARRL